MSKPKLNEPDVEQTTTIPIIETQCTSCSKYPLKNYKINFEELEVLKKFEELGYEYIDYRSLSIMILFKFVNIKNGKKINIWFDRSYSIPNDYDITFQEHQLLHRLFKIWGWLDE